MASLCHGLVLREWDADEQTARLSWKDDALAGFSIHALTQMALFECRGHSSGAPRHSSMERMRQVKFAKLYDEAEIGNKRKRSVNITIRND